MADISDPSLKEEVWDVRDDSTPSNWIALGYASKTKITVVAKGDTGYEGLMEICTDDAVLFCLLRLIDGDRESRRVKFIGLTFVGEDVGGMQRGRVGAHSMQVKTLFGQMNIEISADNRDECALPIIMKKLKVAGGADYDTGSNAGGYKSRGGSIRKQSLAAYKAKEKAGNIKGVIYNTSALSKSTPIDLGGRPTVASASEAKKNTKDTILDTKKFQGKASVVKNAPKTGLVFEETKPGAKTKPAASKPTPTSSKPTAISFKKPAISTRKPSIGKSPTKSPEPPKEEPATQPTSTELSDDPEIRAKQRAERRRARQKAMAEKAREEVASLRATLSDDAVETPAEPQEEEPLPTPQQEEEEEQQQQVVEEEQQQQPEEEEETPAENEEEEPLPQPSETEEAVVEKPPPAKSKAKSLFDDDEDEDDDLFSKPTKTEPEAVVASPTQEQDTRTVQLPYAALKAFLVKHEMLIPDFDGTPEELANVVIEDL